jgi:hypothetical protein
MTKLFEQFALFEQASIKEPSMVPPSLTQSTPSSPYTATDPRQALDDHEATQQAILLLRSLNYHALRQANLSQKFKLIHSLIAEAKIKKGLIPPKLSLRNTYMDLTS